MQSFSILQGYLQKQKFYLFKQEKCYLSKIQQDFVEIYWRICSELQLYVRLFIKKQKLDSVPLQLHLIIYLFKFSLNYGNTKTKKIGKDSAVYYKRNGTNETEERSSKTDDEKMGN